MQELTKKDCVEMEQEVSFKSKVVVLLPRALPGNHPEQLFFCTSIEGTENPRHSIVHLVSLSTGEVWKCWNWDVVGILKPELLGEQARLHLSQIRPFGAVDLRDKPPEYSGYSFLPDGRYAAGVWLADSEEAWEYVMMQKDYQYRVMICDRNDFTVLEMQKGQMIFPDARTLEQLQQKHADGRMKMA